MILSVDVFLVKIKYKILRIEIKFSKGCLFISVYVNNDMPTITFINNLFGVIMVILGSTISLFDFSIYINKRNKAELAFAYLMCTGRVQSVQNTNIKMAAFCVLLGIILSFSHSYSKVPTVEVNVPVEPITLGGILDLEDDHTVEMFRAINGRTEKLTSGLRYFSSSLEHRIFVTKKTIPGGIHVYFMTILDVSMLDHGEYLCKVYELTDGDQIKIAESSTDVEVNYFPNSIYP